LDIFLYGASAVALGPRFYSSLLDEEGVFDENKAALM
jgi:hypothetical protein